MQPILNIALRASRQTSEYINHFIDKQDPAQSDASANKKIVSHLESTLFQNFYDTIKKAYPTHYLVEPGDTMSGVKEDSWHINRIHNPEHLLRKLPTCAFSVIHKRQGKAQDALLANPFSGDEFTASRGGGATLNGRRTRCSSAKSLDAALIATNILKQLPKHADEHVVSALIAELANSAKQIVIGGCDALDVAMVASGQLEAAVLTRVDSFELEAAMLLCQESGVLAGTFSGGLFGQGTDKLIVASPKLFKTLVQRFNSYQSKL